MMWRSFLGSTASLAATALWHPSQWLNRHIADRRIDPPWMPQLAASQAAVDSPPLGVPRETDSLCPRCVIEVRNAILEGRMDWRALRERHPGEVRARIFEWDRAVYMEKTCPEHGTTRDILSMDPAFLRRVESLFPGRDVALAPDGLHDHGASSIRYGRGAVLTIDLTNRCNMMCGNCFMDANQVGYVHELSMADVRRLLGDALTVKPRRQLTVQFSGGEPTLSPVFLEAVAHAREVGYFSVQCASNGVRFATEPEFALQAGQAGLRLVYLQFDGVGNDSNRHRNVSNLFDVKRKAIDNLHAAGVDVTLVMTVVNTINNDQVGRVIRFAAENIDKINAVSFQPVSFTGRDEQIDPDTRALCRYTLSHLAYDVRSQLGMTEPLRDWYPLSASGPLSDFVDHLRGTATHWGSLKCGCHPDCSIGTLMLVHERTKEMIPIADVLDTDRLIEDLRIINRRHRRKTLMVAQGLLSIVRNLKPSAARRIGLPALLRIIDGHTGRHMGLASKARHEWRVLLVAGMAFQDLFNYDLRRTEQCIIPYATQMGEISFCAYNTGVGWRQVVEMTHKNATTAEWFREKGRHPIHAGGRAVPLDSGTVAARGSTGHLGFSPSEGVSRHDDEG